MTLNPQFSFQPTILESLASGAAGSHFYHSVGDEEEGQDLIPQEEKSPELSGGTSRPVTRMNKKATTPQLGRKAASHAAAALRPKSAGSPILQKRALPMPATASGKNWTCIVTLKGQITASTFRRSQVMKYFIRGM